MDHAAAVADDAALVATGPLHDRVLAMRILQGHVHPVDARYVIAPCHVNDEVTVRTVWGHHTALQRRANRARLHDVGHVEVGDLDAPW